MPKKNEELRGNNTDGNLDNSFRQALPLKLLFSMNMEGVNSKQVFEERKTLLNLKLTILTKLIKCGICTRHVRH